MASPTPAPASKFRESDFTVVTTGLEYPEGPISMQDGSVLVCEIKSGKLTRVLPDGSKQTAAHLGGGPNGAAVGPDGAIYVCNDGGFQFFRMDSVLNTFLAGHAPPGVSPQAAQQMMAAAANIWITGNQAANYKGGSIQRCDLKTGSFSTLYEGFVNASRSGPISSDLYGLKSPDDLVFDSTGGFWFTDWGKSRGRTRDVTGVLYAKADGSSINEMIFPLASPNGIALSPDGKRLYVAETMTQRILYWNLAAPGAIVPNMQSLNGGFVLSSGLSGLPDSMTVDEQGNLYVATILANGFLPANGAITIISPQGEILEEMTITAGALPDPLPSNICFGGPDRQTAYITLGGTGRLVSCRMRIPGLAPAFSA